MPVTKRPNILYQDKLLDGATTNAAISATTTIPCLTMDGDYRLEKFEVESPTGYTADAANYYDISLQTAPRAITTVTAATDTLTMSTAHNLITGDAVQFTNSGGGLPAGLVAGTTYYAVVVDSLNFKVADTNAHALAGTNIIDITTAGTGTQSFAKLLAIYSLLTGQQGSLSALTFASGALLGTPVGLKGDQLNVVLTKFGTAANFPAGSVFNAHLKQVTNS